MKYLEFRRDNNLVLPHTEIEVPDLRFLFRMYLICFGLGLALWAFSIYWIITAVILP